MLVALQHRFEAAQRPLKGDWDDDPEGIPFEGFDRESPLPSPRYFQAPTAQLPAPEVTPEVDSKVGVGLSF